MVLVVFYHRDGGGKQLQNRLMNKKVWFVLVTFCGLLSCSQDNIDEDVIEGNYRLLEIRNFNCEDVADDARWDLVAEKCVIAGQEVDCIGVEVVYAFEDDGSFSISSDGSNSLYFESFVTGQYTYEDDIIEMCDEDGQCINGTFDLNADRLIISSADDDEDGCELELILERQ